MKTWKPDTCECHVEEVYDGTQIVGGGRVLRKCAVHSTVPDQDLYGVLYEGENKVKNQMLRILLGHEEIKGLGLEEVKKNPDGSDAGLGLKPGVQYEWSFEGAGTDRKLRVRVSGATLSPAQKNSIRALADTRFGVGKVILT